MRPALPLGLLLLTSGSVTAQVRQGSQELNASGTATFADNFSVISIVTQYGYFLTPSVEIGPSVEISRSSVEVAGTDRSTTSGLIGGFGHVHLGRRGSRSLPYLGAEVGIGVGDADGELFGIVGGVKHFIAPGAAITPTAFFQFDGDGDSRFGARFGISAFF